MNWLKKTYRALANHLGKILSGVGATLVGLDMAGMAGQIKDYAAQYLGDQPTKKIGMVLFALLFLRTLYTGIKAKTPAAVQPK